MNQPGSVQGGLALTVTAPQAMAGDEFVLGERELTVGRGSTSDIRINDPYVSRRHAMIRWVEGELVIEDAQSSAGVVVNGERLAQPRALRVGDRIRLGTVELELQRKATGEESITPDVLEAVTPEIAGTETSTAAPEADEVSFAVCSPPPSTFADLDLDPDAARQLLIEWASHKPLVDEKVFLGELTVENAPRVRCCLVRLIEAREEKEGLVRPQEHVPALERYSGSVETVTLPQPGGFDPESWRLVLAGSEQPVACPANCTSGGQQCSRCHGRGKTPCAHCHGSGQQVQTRWIQGKASTQNRTCTFCHGSGRQRCGKCRGSGWLPCDTCQGAGSMISFVIGEINRTPTDVTISERLPDGITENKVPSSEWVTVATTSGESVPDIVPSHLRTELSRELEERPTSELKRKLVVRVLPHAVVRLAGQPEAAVHIVGSSKTVFASGVRSRRRLGWGVAAVLAVAAVLVMVIVLTHSA